jgi:AraC-like DNA-binding protein
VPDGCRDLIVTIKEGQAPVWKISPLFDRSEMIHIDENTRSWGFRLQPGVSIDENRLLENIGNEELYIDKVESALNECIYIDPNTQEALACLSRDASSIAQAAAQLGVSTRTLQRHLQKSTDRTPGYWFQLARARKAAQHLILNTSLPFIEVANTYGFSDQSHMSREFNRWFQCSPSDLLNCQEMTDQLMNTGYSV